MVFYYSSDEKKTQIYNYNLYKKYSLPGSHESCHTCRACFHNISKPFHQNDMKIYKHKHDNVSYTYSDTMSCTVLNDE